MAVETVTRTTCDRCTKVVEEVPASADTKEQATGPLLFVQADGEEIRFDDLCQKCKDRCAHLLSQIRLDRPEEKGEDDKPPVDAKPESKDSKDSPKGASKKPPKDKGGADASPPSN